MDEQDRPVGSAEKLAAHQDGGQLHRAFSVFVFNSRKELMLQKRASHKYHSGGLWTNTCCSHPAPGEDTVAAGHRRLVEEMGFDCELRPLLSFIYRAELDQGLTEHEFDHVLVGSFDGAPVLNPEEADDWRWISTDNLMTEVAAHPDRFTEWFKIVLQRVLAETAFPGRG